MNWFSLPNFFASGDYLYFLCVPSDYSRFCVSCKGFIFRRLRTLSNPCYEPRISCSKFDPYRTWRTSCGGNYSSGLIVNKSAWVTSLQLRNHGGARSKNWGLQITLIELKKPRRSMPICPNDGANSMSNNTGFKTVATDATHCCQYRCNYARLWGNARGSHKASTQRQLDTRGLYRIARFPNLSHCECIPNLWWCMQSYCQSHQSSGASYVTSAFANPLV